MTEAPDPNQPDPGEDTPATNPTTEPAPEVTPPADQSASGDGSAHRRLLTATAVMASGTMVSRILGFARAILLAFVLGNGTRQVEMFGTATLIPNSLYMLFAGGALNTVLVPQIVRAIKNDADGGQAFVNRIMTAFLAALAVVGTLMTLASPAALMLWTSSTWRTPALAEQYASLQFMTYLTMPQLFFFGAFFLVGQVLNARDRFGPMMWAPIANNVIQIIVLGIYAWVWGTHGDTSIAFTSGQAWLLGAGSTLGIIIQTLILIPYLRRAGFSFTPRWDLKGTGLGRTFHVAKWMLGYTAVTMIAQTVIWNLATSAVAGGAGAGGNVYTNAYLIWILPHSLLTVSLATAMLPSASRKAAAGDLLGVEEETTRTVRLATTFLLPGSLGLLVLADPIARLAFGHGRGADDAHFVAWTLMAFAIGLVPYTIQYLYLRGFYAMEETRIPFWLQVVISGLNAALALAFVLAWNNPDTVAPRLALSYSLAYVVGWWLSHRALKRHLPTLSGRTTLRYLGRVLLASLPAAAFAWGVAWGFSRFTSVLLQVLGLVLAGVVAVLTFFFAAKRLEVREAAELLTVLRRRGGAASEDPAGKASAGVVAGQPIRPTDPVASPRLAAPVGPASTPGAVLDYPDPADGHIPVDVRASEPGLERVATGEVLVARYRLDELLVVRERVQTWRAFDERLSRSVLLHVLPADDPRAEELLDLARRASAAIDSRLLRVLDAGMPAPDAGHGAYVVYEYAIGVSLEKVLREGPLSGVEAAWIVRELAEALTGLHAEGLFHERLNPDTVVITAAGNVKIVGLLVEAGFTAGEDGVTPQQADALGLGRILYASLVARWPGSAQYGLRDAPTDGARLLTPGQVRPGIARPLDILADRILNLVPRNRQARITTAAGIAQALADVLGPATAAADLERRLRLPVEPLRPRPLVAPAVAVLPSDSASSAVTGAIASQRTPSEAWLLDEMDAYDHTEPFTPVPPPPPRTDQQTAPTPGGSAPQVPAAPRVGGFGGSVRRWAPLGLLITVVVMLVSVAVWAASGWLGPAGPSSSPTVAATVVPIAATDDFDPSADGGSGNENPKLVDRAIDRDRTSAWLTERYRGKPELGGLKPGVGLIVDLGKPVPVTSVAVSLIGNGTDLQIRVPQDLAASAPSGRTEKDWRTVASASRASGTVSLTLDAPTTTRFLLVYLTSLPPEVGNYYQGGISNLEVRR